MDRAVHECLVHSARDCECELRRRSRAQQRRWFVVLLEERDTQPGSTRTNFSTRFLTVGYSSDVDPHAQEPLRAVGERTRRHAESEREARGLMLNGQGRRRARGTKACAKRVPAAARMLVGGERTRPRGRGPSTCAVGPEVHRQKAGEERGVAQFRRQAHFLVRDPRIPEPLTGPEGLMGMGPNVQPD